MQGIASENRLQPPAGERPLPAVEMPDRLIEKIRERRRCAAHGRSSFPELDLPYRPEEHEVAEHAEEGDRADEAEAANEGFRAAEDQPDHRRGDDAGEIGE